MELIDTHLPAHVAYLETQYSLGNFVLSGRKEPRIGGVILSALNNRERLEEILEEDPFKQHDLGHYQIIKFSPSMANEEFKFLIEP